MYSSPDGQVRYSSITNLDHEAGTIDLLWKDEAADLDVIPTTLVRNDWVPVKVKAEAVSELAADVLTGTTANPVSVALLHRDRPNFDPGTGPAGGMFTDDLDDMLGGVTHLDQSVLAIQGPPGTGKTYRGARLVRALLQAGLRVGITAMGHRAIDNLLEVVVEAFAEADDDSLRAVRRGSSPATGALPGVTYAANNKAAAKPEFNLVAATTWPFAGNDLHNAPVDVLLVDEAGQLSLADALAAARSARNLILLGDPQQLPQVAQAAHPNGSGASVLEHILGEHDTMPIDRGVLITETRRMHPDVCGFISEQFYENRLTSHPDCARQSTTFGTGLRWLPAYHAGRVTESIEEADIIIAQSRRLLGTPWTNSEGQVHPIGIDDILIVAPYNDQVAFLRSTLDEDPTTAGIEVGTVDKFQGRQAAVVFFSMTTSSAADMHRSTGFLFSRNRFNVAISRARCLAYLVCTEELLDSRGRDVEEMRLISTLCAFVETASTPTDR